MRPSDWLARLDRWQHATLFKVVASILVLVGAIAATGSYAVARAAERNELRLVQASPAAAEAAAAAVTADQTEAGQQAREQAAKAARETSETLARTINSVLERRLGVLNFGIGAALVAGVLLVVIWLGLALTYLAVAGAAGVLAGPLLWWGSEWWRGFGAFVLGALALAASFSALVQVLRLALSGSHPVLSIARNVVAEAVRMKISLIFIVMLILALAALPGLLDAGTPLRYRVQAFITYGVGFTFWITAVMVLFLACGTVAFEQRDKIIWQTMTKPVAPWQFVAGKWLGVSAMAAVLLGVSAAGVFLFTEFLRSQRALGEAAPFVSAGSEPIANDRLLLETQVLTSRQSVQPVLPARDGRAVAAEVERRLGRALQDDPTLRDSAAERTRILDQINAEELQQFLAIEPGQSRVYVFEGLQYARANGLPLTLRFKFNAGTNIPTETYRVTFYVDNAPPFVLECRLGQRISEPLAPTAVTPEGVLKLEVTNGDIFRREANRETMSFPPGELEVFYPVGSFRENFGRVVVIMWAKLAFMAMVGVAASTFLSFPVAAMVSFGVLFCAESARYVQSALDQYSTVDFDQKTILWWRFPIMWIATAVSWVFASYAGVSPTRTLAEGMAVPWSLSLSTLAALAIMTSALGMLASLIFRQRELATYSGQ